MPVRARATVIVMLTFVLPLLLVQPATSTAAQACPERFELAGVGLVCPIKPGLFEVFAPDGSSQGYTHGPDARHSHDAGNSGFNAVAGDTVPRCVDGAPGTHYIRVLYARAFDDTDRYATQLPIIRREVGKANALVDDAAIATSDRLSMRLLCTPAGDISVENVVLPTKMTSASFSTIVSDLRAKGYADLRQKYWVYYDDGNACACLGVAHIYADESPGIENRNNGAAGTEPMFAVVFDSPEQHSMLHELAHTLGAVQDGAPYSTLAGHCFDGRDTMCYNDGGPRGSLYTITACSVAVFDCGKNTYCNAYPDAGTYLSNHWQVCSRVSRYLTYPPNEAPIVIDLSCGPSPSYPTENVTCSFRATDAGPRVHYTFDWGDGTTLRVPETGTVPSGALQNVSRVFTQAGTLPVRITATDIGTPPLTSAPATFTHQVLPAQPPPALDALSCTPGMAKEGDVVTCVVNATTASPVVYTLTWGDGSAAVRLPASGSAPSGQAQSATHVYGRGGDYQVNVTALDEGRPPRSASTSVVLAIEDVNTAPVLTFLQCAIPRPRPGQSAPCNFRAEDDSNGVAYFVSWGDGQTTRVPAAGYTSPGVTQTAAHVYAADGNYTVQLYALDDGQPPYTSDTLTTLHQVAADQEGPNMTLLEPKAGILYRGCSKLGSPNPNVSPTPIFFQRGCASVTATDPAGVTMVEVLRGTTVIARDFVAPFELSFDVPDLEMDAFYRVRAWDAKGNARLISFNAHAIQGTADR